MIRDRKHPRWQRSLGNKVIETAIAREMEKNICYGKDCILGFPGTSPLPIAAEIYAEYLGRHPNNIGLHSNATKSELGFGGSQEIERQVIEMAADLMGASPYDVDGYISSGGTEANIMGCWIGRDRAKGRKAALVCSFLTHYSVAKACNMLGIGSQPQADGSGLNRLGTDENGHLLIPQLRNKLAELIMKGIGNIIIVANAGTTMLGSVDNVAEICKEKSILLSKFPEINVHIHVDAAFGGFVIPFIDGLPEIGFQNELVDSVTIDVHKMGLAPYGSGIILARHGLFSAVETHAPYVPGNDHTICGSRSGAMALSCWAAMRSMGKRGYAKKVSKLMDLADRIR
jgi:tyrosine decarboxylase/aspartate 1-decarboxylase